MPPSKVARVLCAWQVGRGNYTIARHKFFAGDSGRPLRRLAVWRKRMRKKVSCPATIANLETAKGSCREPGLFFAAVKSNYETCETFSKARRRKSFLPKGCPVAGAPINLGNKWDYAPAPEDSKNYVIAPRHELFIDGKFVAPSSGKYFDSINPATEEKLTEIARGECAGRGPRGESRPPRLRKSLEQDARARARQISLSHRAHHPGKVARTGGARNDGRRQDHQGKPRRGSAAGGRAFLLSRRLGGQVEIRLPRAKLRSRSASRARSSRGIFRC